MYKGPLKLEFKGTIIVYNKQCLPREIFLGLIGRSLLTSAIHFNGDNNMCQVTTDLEKPICHSYCK